MGLTVYWTQFAEEKLEDIYLYHKLKASRDIARKLVKGIVDQTIILKNKPNIGQVEPLLKERKQEFKYLIFKNYKVIYWVNIEASRIEIVNVFDTRQNPIKIKKTE